MASLAVSLPVWLLFFTASLSVALEVLVSPQILKPALGVDVTIDCDFTLDRPIDPQFMYVVWRRNGLDVISYFSGTIKVLRAGAQFIGELAKGKASLLLPRIGIGDEGVYECAVIASPDERSATSILRISVSPSVTPIGPLLELEPGFKRSVPCEALRFYPEEISIVWFKISAAEVLQEMTGQEIHGGNLVRNSDGTFNTASVLTLRAPPVLGGANYICQVSHELSGTVVKQRLTITVMGSPPWHTWFPVSCAVILLIVIVVALIISKQQLVDLPVCLKHFSKVKVQIRLQPEEALQGQHISGMCSFRGFSLKSKRIVVCIRKNNVETRVLQKRYGMGDLAGGKLELLGEAINSFTASMFTEDSPTIFMSFPADVRKHNRAEFVCRVIETRTKKIWEGSVRFSVIGVPQEVQLPDPGPVKHGDSVTLSCNVTQFSPKAMTVRWRMKAKGVVHTISEESYGPPGYEPSHPEVRFSGIKYEIMSPVYTGNQDRTVNCRFGLTFQADIEAHDQREFLCEISHETLDSPLKKSLCMTVTRRRTVSFEQTRSTTPDELSQEEKWDGVAEGEGSFLTVENDTKLRDE